MSFYLTSLPQEHRLVLSSTLQAWARDDQVHFIQLSRTRISAPCFQDLFLVSKESHRVYTSQKLLALYSSTFTSLASSFIPSTPLDLSLPFTSVALSSRHWLSFQHNKVARIQILSSTMQL